jgi:hypothetical protein
MFVTQVGSAIALSGGSAKIQRPRASQLGRRCVETSGDVIDVIQENSWKLVKIYYLRDAFRRLIPFRCVNGRSSFETASDATMIPSGAKHRFTNRSQKRAVIFNVYPLPVYPVGLIA